MKKSGIDLWYSGSPMSIVYHWEDHAMSHSTMNS